VAVNRPIPAPPIPTRSALRTSAPTPSAPPSPSPTTVMIRPWIDPLVDETGHDPRSLYVERFWLGVLGPTATWVLRRLTAGLADHEDGYRTDLGSMARAMGLSFSPSRSSPFSKALQRCTMFGLAHQTSDGFAVRRRIPTVAHRHLRRMPDSVRDEHDRWESAHVETDQFERAHGLAMAMLAAGDDCTMIEHQLTVLGVDNRVAAQVADNAASL